MKIRGATEHSTQIRFAIAAIALAAIVLAFPALAITQTSPLLITRIPQV